MAEEFNVSDMPTTDRYKIPYPGTDNLVRFAADQFGAMAQAIDTQLGNVDDRATDKAHATIVRNTLTELQQTDPVQGQLGYVTDDPTMDNIGLWMWNGSSWSKVSGATPLTVVKPNLTELQKVSDLSEGVFGLVTSDPIATNNGVYVWSNSVWSPITGTAGGTLAADTLEQLESTTAPTGTLAYVSNDPKTSNNGVYVRTASGEWDRVGSSETTDSVTMSLAASNRTYFAAVASAEPETGVVALAKPGSTAVANGELTALPSSGTLTIRDSTMDDVPCWKLPGKCLCQAVISKPDMINYTSSANSGDLKAVFFDREPFTPGTIIIDGVTWQVIDRPCNISFIYDGDVHAISTWKYAYMTGDTTIDIKCVRVSDIYQAAETESLADELQAAEPAADAPSPVIEEDNHESQ